MTDAAQLQAEAREFQRIFLEVREAIGRVIVGQQRTVEAALVAIFAGGNVLLEGVPGLGKTELVKAMSRVLDLDFRRIQFTPDLMPADIIGTNIMTSDEAGRYRFEFRRGRRASAAHRLGDSELRTCTGGHTARSVLSSECTHSR